VMKEVAMSGGACTPWSSAAIFLAMVLALMTAACSSHLGQGQGNSVTPDAVITPIGNVPTSAAGAGPVTITVRSGSDVVMSAKDSNGLGVALTQFDWKQISGPALPGLPDAGALLYRSTNTVSFRAPQVTAKTALGFQLTVTNAQGTSSTATITVTVIQANDPDEFLVATANSTGHKNRFTVAVMTMDGFGTAIASPLPADVPACLQVTRQLSYQDRAGSANTTAAGSLAPLQADVAWSKGTVVVGAQPGASPDIQNAAQSFSNPRADFAIPTFNEEELFALYNQPSHLQLDLQLVPSDVDTGTVQLAIQAVAGSCDGTRQAPALANESLVVAVVDANGNVVMQSAPGAPLATSADNLMGIAGTQPVQTAASARAYYQAIDPNAFTSYDPKSTLSGWLSANCFDPTVADYGTGAAGANGAHAVYTNNFDLGFGRDMYFIRCAADHTDSTTGNITARQGDMASVVVNYPSLEQTALKDGLIIAVAMEYSAAADGSGRRFPKFYVFAPDDRTGQLKRVLSANFDHRGQKYVPGACTACHGGNMPAWSPGSSQYPAVQDPTSMASCSSDPSGCLVPGDVDSAFLPWDADAFLYSDAPAAANRDPAFLGNLIGGAPYTRQMQEPNLRALNLLAYATYQPENETVGAVTGVDRFAAARALVEHWYGGSGFPQTTFTASTYTDFTDASPPAGWMAQPAGAPIYHGMLARNCRTCHTVDAKPSMQFSGLNSLVPGDGYSLLVDSFTSGPMLGQSYLFQQGTMPLARLTMDRLWVNFSAPTDASQAGSTLLAKNLGLTGGAAIVGTPYAAILSSINNVPTTNGPLDCSSNSTLNRGDTVRLSGAPSDFASSATWTLAFVPCDVRFASNAVLVGKAGSEAAFSPDVPGVYTATLTATNGSASSQQTATVMVVNKIPSITGPVTTTTAPLLESFVASQPIALTGKLGDGSCAQHQLIIAPGSAGSVTAGACVTSIVAGISYFTIPLNYVPAAVGPDVVQVSIQDIDGDSSGIFSVYIDVTSSVTANAVTLFANAGTPAPAANLCVLQQDALNGQASIALSIGNGISNANGVVSVLTDTSGTICGTTPYLGQMYLTYQAPNGYIGADSFTYSLQGAGGQIASNIVSVTVTGTIDFATQILPSLTTRGCVACHGVGGPFDTFLPAAGGTVSMFYSALCAGMTTGPCTSTLVTASSPATSPFYIVPNLVTPPPPMPSANGTAWIADLLQWINEGAYCKTDGSLCAP
jgi:PKD repeat protein